MQFIPMKALNIGETITAGIVVYADLNDFFMKKLYPDESTYDNAFLRLDFTMQYEYDSTKSSCYEIETPYIGQAVAARFSQDNKWYRAEIFEIVPKSNMINVIFVDYGNKETIELKDLRYLLPHYLKYEIQIFRCTLHGIDLSNASNLIKATNFFYDTTDELNKLNKKSLKLTVKNIRGETSHSTQIFERLSNRIHEVHISYPIEDKILNENSNLVKFLYPAISVQTDRHVFLIRHGQYNNAPESENRVLTALGAQQADVTGKYLKDLNETFNFIKINTSTIVRAKQTTDFISKHFPDLELSEDPLLCELDPMLINDKNIQIKEAFSKYFRKGSIYRNNEALILVCHANLIRSFFSKINHGSVKFWNHYGLHHASVTHVIITSTGEILCSDFDFIDFIPEQLKTFV